MPNYYLYAIKNRESVRIKDFNELVKIDSYTRKFRNEQSAIIDLKNSGKINFICEKLRIQYQSNHEQHTLKPIYAEAYKSKKGIDIYEQVMSFANQIGEIYKECEEYKNSDIYREQIKLRMEKIGGLDNRQFYSFVKNIFKERFYKVENMKKQLESNVTAINAFDANCVDDNGKVISGLNKELYENFYCALFSMFYKLFYTSSGNISDKETREFYRKYYNKFIEPYVQIDDDQYSLNDYTEFTDFNDKIDLAKKKETKKDNLDVMSIDETKDELYDSYDFEEDGIIYTRR